VLKTAGVAAVSPGRRRQRTIGGMNSWLECNADNQVTSPYHRCASDMVLLFPVPPSRISLVSESSVSSYSGKLDFYFCKFISNKIRCRIWGNRSNLVWYCSPCWRIKKTRVDICCHLEICISFVFCLNVFRILYSMISIILPTAMGFLIVYNHIILYTCFSWLEEVLFFIYWRNR
jgi:hypothetical protein